ncbi:hypothetical protein T439DRAFT_328729 [Meredithblackwellia eburnea MCA 4105]
MVRLARLAALMALPVASLAQFGALQDMGNSVARKVLMSVFRMNETQVERILETNTTLPTHPYAVDLTDKNWEAVLRTGTDNPLENPLPDDTVWAVLVHAQDQISKLFVEAFNEVATHNSSASGGSLPPNIKFARLNYGSETILTTRWWLWKVPVLVISTKNQRHLRFFKQGQLPPFQIPIARLLSERETWENWPIWTGSLAPGGSREWMLIPIAEYWALFHSKMSKIPNFVLLMLSGVLMNFVLGWFHTEKPKQATMNPVTPNEERRAQIKAKIAKEKAEASGLGTSTSAPTKDVPSVEGSSGVKTRTASKRK